MSTTCLPLARQGGAGIGAAAHGGAERAAAGVPGEAAAPGQPAAAAAAARAPGCQWPLRRRFGSDGSGAVRGQVAERPRSVCHLARWLHFELSGNGRGRLGAAASAARCAPGHTPPTVRGRAGDGGVQRRRQQRRRWQRPSRGTRPAGGSCQLLPLGYAYSGDTSAAWTVAAGCGGLGWGHAPAEPACAGLCTGADRQWRLWFTFAVGEW